MKKINFTCPHCGGHQLIVEQPLQWIQLPVLGLDDEGNLMLDHDRPSIVDDDGDDYEIYCSDYYKQFTEQELNKMKTQKAEEGNK